MEVRTDSRLNWHISNGGHIVITLFKEIQQAVQAAERSPVRFIDSRTRVEYVVLPVGGK